MSLRLACYFNRPYFEPDYKTKNFCSGSVRVPEQNATKIFVESKNKKERKRNHV